jgi:hypothetical protein
VQRSRHLGAHGHAAARQGDDDGVEAPGIGGQLGGERLAGVLAVPEMINRLNQPASAAPVKCVMNQPAALSATISNAPGS